MTQYFPFLLMALAVLLFVLPARARKRVQAQAKAMQDSLTFGTAVMTTSGLHGTIAGLGEGTVDLEIAPGVVVTFARQAILEVRSATTPGTGDGTSRGTVDGTVRPGDDAPGTTGGHSPDGI